MITMPSGKSYIGITVRGLDTRMSQHRWLARHGSSYALHAAMRKYGIDTAKAVKLMEAKWQFLKLMEPLAIGIYGTKAPGGYNLTDGGEGVLGLSAESRERIAAGQRGRKCSEQTRAAVSLAQRGRVHSAAHRYAAGSAFRGKRRSPEEIAKRVATRRARRGGAYL